ncbi:hypothetical protein P154DRAFT_304577 [Amniculicola lignicola CBS 123094]|uniref:Zn(2)-C6 fungal-type domain-containing protein n=1 Tax=Amniculicola lignicola CBS 123094 TaxID=1392246 RepID=A0A6A5W4R2_9PLEO|nr:hypothetical protein P154DRAFT_304577 [Amniculicola lignicola CBS 123094]
MHPRITAGPASRIPPPAESVYTSRVPALHGPDSQRLPSPLAQQSPATVAASPMTAHPSPMGLQLSPQAAHPPAAGAADHGAADRRAADNSLRSRSAIACQKCRRSKVKCDNDGPDTTCKGCRAVGRACVYLTPGAPSSAPERRESIGGDRAIKLEPSRRSRMKKAASSTSSTPYHLKDSPRADVDALNPELLTPAVWKELFEIFKKHYVTDLPFLHASDFSECLSELQAQKDQDPTSSAHPPFDPAWLLAFLALTSKFHKGIVYHHDPVTTRIPDAMKAATYYAKNSRDRLPLTGDPSLQRVQALLMLGLHDWGMFHGSTAWHSIGAAIREAQLLGLHIEEERVDQQVQDSQASPDGMQIDSGAGSSQDDNKIIEAANKARETRRRTFWSCFIFDRYLSSGRLRISSFQDFSELHVQLPCSDNAFIYGLNVKTSQLPGFRERSPCQDGNSIRPKLVYDDTEVGDKEGDLSRFIRSMDIFWAVLKWSCRGGRRIDGSTPPWESKSNFYNFDCRLGGFRKSLPPRLASSSKIIQRIHGSMGAIQHFILMHTVLLLCDIMNNREYLVFLPKDLSKPIGPTEGPTFRAEDVPEGFWERSARKCFKSARELLDLLCACDGQGVLVETPLSGFTAFQLAVVAIYCRFFPQMDIDHHMTSLGTPPDSIEAARENARVNAEKATFLLKKMAPRWQMNVFWDKQLDMLNKYLPRAAEEYLKKYSTGHGLRDYQVWESFLKEICADRDVDVHRESDPKFSKFTKEERDLPPNPYSPGHHNDDKNDLKSEDDSMETDATDTMSSHPESGFTAINNGRDATKTESGGGEAETLKQPSISHDNGQHPFAHHPHNHQRYPEYVPSQSTVSASRTTVNAGQHHDQNATYGPSPQHDFYNKLSELQHWPHHLENFTNGEPYANAAFPPFVPDQGLIGTGGMSFWPGYPSYS